MKWRELTVYDIILFAIVLLVSGVIAWIVRLLVINKGFDEGSAIIASLLALGVCLTIYLIILATVRDAVIPLIMKVLPPRKKRPRGKIFTVDKEKVLETANRSRQNHAKEESEELSNRISIFKEFTHKLMGIIITDEELLRLDEYVEFYIREKKPSENIVLIKTKRKYNSDIKHFGWNMAEFFEIEKQKVASWLQDVFVEMRKLDYNSIKNKFKEEYKNEIIPIVNDIPKYLEELKKREKGEL